MSKASEWAAAPTFPRMDLVWRPYQTLTAEPVLFPSGLRCWVRVEGIMSVPDALALARWIVDTFGEPDEAPAAP